MRSQLIAGTLLLLLLTIPVHAAILGGFIASVGSLFDQIMGALFGYRPDAESLCFEKVSKEYKPKLHSLDKNTAEAAYHKFEACKQNPPVETLKDCSGKADLIDTCELIENQCPAIAAQYKDTPGSGDACDIGLGKCQQAVRKNYAHCKTNN